MKADTSDAPERVNRRHHKHGVFSMVICLILGSAATMGALQAISRGSNIDAADKSSTRPNGGENELIRFSGMPPKQDPGGAHAQASSDIHLPADAARQTVFNDENFIAKGADNVLTFRVSSSPPPGQDLSKPVKITIVGESHRIKEQACRFLKQGSVESRNCRAWIGLRHRN
jgi:hypothetical protein